jgi:hypothetical protein
MLMSQDSKYGTTNQNDKMVQLKITTLLLNLELINNGMEKMLNTNKYQI